MKRRDRPRQRSKTMHEAWAELGDAQRAFGRDLLDTAPVRWLVALVEWLARKIEG